MVANTKESCRDNDEVIFDSIQLINIFVVQEIAK